MVLHPFGSKCMFSSRHAKQNMLASLLYEFDPVAGGKQSILPYIPPIECNAAEIVTGRSGR